MLRYPTALLWIVLVLTGCASTRPDTPVRVDTGTETVAFSVAADRVDVVDAATAVLVGNDFTITLANERLGLLQTDYASVASIEAIRADSGRGHEALTDLYMRLTVNADNRDSATLVRIKGNFQRMGTGSAPDRIIGLYWMDRLAADIAEYTGAEYAPAVSTDTYHQALDNAMLPVENTRRQSLSRGLRATGIVGVTLFAATLLANVLAPSGNR